MSGFTVRQALTRDDAQFALRCLASEGSRIEELEAELRDAGIDALLDNPALLRTLLSTPRGAHASLPLFTYVVVRAALRDAGEDDRSLADLVASIVMRFGLRDRAWRVSEVDDEVYVALTDLLRDVDCADRRRAFKVRMHLGHYALWLSGMFPDHVEYRRWRRGGPNLDYFDELGARGYRLAADHRLAREQGVAALLTLAADRFSTLRVALNTVSDRLLFPDINTPERLMRQVRGNTLLAWRVN